MRKLLITLALVAAPALAAAQQPAKPAQHPAAAHDSTKAKAKAKPAHHVATKTMKKKTARTSHDSTKAKSTPTDSAKKPN